MKKHNILFLAFSIVLASACYKDLGNYDYKDIQRVEISFEEQGPYNVILGDELNVKAIYPDFVEQHPENYEFQWSIDDETRPEWNTKDFKWTADKIFDRGVLLIEVTDKRNGVVYMKTESVNVKGVYTNDNSWMILSDKDGKSQLSFLSVTDLIDQESAEQPAGSKQYYYKNSKFIADVFIGELGSGPIAIQEHWREPIDWSEQVVGNVCIFQESGAVDLEGTGFTKEIDMEEAFMDGKYPAENTVLYPGSFITATDVVCDQDGKLYSRLKLSPTVYNSEYFLQTPLKVKGEDEPLEQCKVCRGFYASNRFGYQIIYDGKNKRMLYLKDESFMDGNAGVAMITPAEMSEDINTNNIVPMNDHSGYELLYISQYCVDYDAYGFFEVLKKEDDNTVHLQRFVSKNETWTAPDKIVSVEKKEIKGLPAVPSVMAFPTYSIQEYAFFAIGQDLYILDLVNMSTAELFYHFDSNITAMDYGSTDNTWLAVGLEDGTFCVLGTVEAKNIKNDDHKLVYKSEEKVGKIVDIKYKNNSMWNY